MRNMLTTPGYCDMQIVKPNELRKSALSMCNLSIQEIQRPHMVSPGSYKVVRSPCENMLGCQPSSTSRLKICSQAISIMGSKMPSQHLVTYREQVLVY